MTGAPFARLRHLGAEIWTRLRRAAPGAARAGPVDFRALTDNSNDVIMQCDAGGRTIYASPSVRRLLGVPPEEVVQRGHLHFVLAEDLPALRDAIARHAAGQQDVTATFRMRHAGGGEVWVEANAKTVGPNRGGRISHVVVLRDVTECKRLEAQLEALGLTDGLTGLANRRAFDLALDREWRRTARGDARSLSLLVLDADHFKRLNDQYGHQVGDDCLRSLAMALRRSLGRPGDLAARYGGEEMAAILPDTDAEGALMVAESVRAAVAAMRIPHSGNPEGGGVMTVSIGAATATCGLDGTLAMPASLLQAADAALYRAKRGGRNRCERAPVLESLPRMEQASAGR